MRNTADKEEKTLQTGMPTAIVLMVFGIYWSVKYNPLFGGVTFLAGLILMLVLLNRKRKVTKSAAWYDLARGIGLGSEADAKTPPR